MGDQTTGVPPATTRSSLGEKPSTGISIRNATNADRTAIAKLHERALGPGRFSLTAYRVREGTIAVSPFCQVAEHESKIIAAVRFTPVQIGGQPGALLLGPLAVDPDHTSIGLGTNLILAGAKAAREQGQKLILLVGALSYYGRHGFKQITPGRITLPGPVDPARLLALELEPDALEDFAGPIIAA